MLAVQSDDTIMVLENGCLCCTVFGDLVITLNNLYHPREDGDIPRFDHVVIETSGLADPSPLIQAFLLIRRSPGSTASRRDRDGRRGERPATLDEHVELVRQVALADQILITKLDLIDPAKAKADEAALTARLRRLNPAAKISPIDDPTFDIGEVLRAGGLIRPAPRPMPAPGSMPPPTSATMRMHAHHPHDHHVHADRGHADHDHRDDHHGLHDRDIASFCFIRDDPIPREALRLLLDALQQNLGPNLLRVKGLIHVVEEPERPAVIQGAQHLLHNLTFLERWPDADRRSKIVFITQNFDRAEVEDMIALLDRVATRTAAARARASAIAKCDQRIARGAPLTT